MSEDESLTAGAALVECPECGGDGFSDPRAACPTCGHEARVAITCPTCNGTGRITP